MLFTKTQHPSAPTLVYWQQRDTFPWGEPLLPKSPQTKSTSQHFAAALIQRLTQRLHFSICSCQRDLCRCFSTFFNQWSWKDINNSLLELLMAWRYKRVENKGNIQELLCFSPILFVCPFWGSEFKKERSEGTSWSFSGDLAVPSHLSIQRLCHFPTVFAPPGHHFLQPFLPSRSRKSQSRIKNTHSMKGREWCLARFHPSNFTCHQFRCINLSKLSRRLL